jgi:hypothetical protein
LDGGTGKREGNEADDDETPATVVLMMWNDEKYGTEAKTA